MSMLVLILVAATSAGVSSVLAARAIRRRRARARAESAAVDLPRAPDPFAGVAVRIGDVVQFGDDTRWPDAALLVYRGDEALHAAVLLSNEHGKQDATVVFPHPDRNLYWLTARDVELPSSPPTRIELAGMLLDRRSLLPVSYRALGEAPAIGARGTFALYDGSVGDAAIVMTGDVTLVWHGQRLAPDDYDNLGKAD